MNIKNTVKAYTAGLIDGEGSIQINPSAGNNNKKFWGLTVQVSSCSLETLQEMQQIWSIGKVTSWTPNKGTAKQQSHNWRIYSEQCEYLLRMVLPYLRIKHKNAEIALEFRKVCGFQRGGITPEIREQRLKLALELRELNRKYGKGKIRNTDFSNIF